MSLPPPPPRGLPPPPNVPSTNRVVLAPDLSIDPLELVGKTIAITGTTGSGKSTTDRTLLEQMLKVGYPFTVADIDNEYVNLKEMGQVILAGPSVDHGRIRNDVTLANPKQCYALARRAYGQRLSVVLLLADLDDETRKLFLEAYARGLFEAAADPEHRNEHFFAIEEIHEYCPQVGIAKDDPLRVAIIRLGKRGRKRKISLGLISQRPANIDKDVLTMAHIFLCHFVTYATDITTYKNILPFKDIDERIPSMEPGDVWFMHGKRQVETRVSLPKTTSPFDSAGSIDVTRFVTVSGAQSIESEVAQVEDREGTSVVPTAYLRGLEESLPRLTSDLQIATERAHTLEAQMSVLQSRHGAAGDAPIPSDVLDELTALRERVREAEALASPIRLLLGHLQAEVTKGNARAAGRITI